MRKKELNVAWWSVILLLALSQYAIAGNDYLACAEVLNTQPKQVHTSVECLSLANSGKADIQYAVGMSYGHAGNSEKELAYYQSAASRGYIPAYLAIGHVLRSEPYHNEKEAIKWYEKFAESKYTGYGYAAILLSKLYAKHGNNEASHHWFEVCQESAYVGCAK